MFCCKPNTSRLTGSVTFSTKRHNPDSPCADGNHEYETHVSIQACLEWPLLSVTCYLGAASIEGRGLCCVREAPRSFSRHTDAACSIKGYAQTYEFPALRLGLLPLFQQTHACFPQLKNAEKRGAPIYRVIYIYAIWSAFPYVVNAPYSSISFGDYLSQTYW